MAGNSSKIAFKLTGLDEMVRRLRKLDRDVSGKIVKKAIGAGTKVMLDAMKDEVPVRSGLTRKAIDRKIKVYRHSGVIAVIMGPRTKSKAAKPGKDGKIKQQAVSHIAHLIEFGHRIAAYRTGTLDRVTPTGQKSSKRAGISKVTGHAGGGQVAGYVMPNPFMRRAYERTKDQCMSIIRQEMARGIEMEASR